MVFIEWTDQFELGVARMDESHRAFISLLNKLNGASLEELPALFDKLVEHTERHFAEEERWMRESGFIPIVIHRDEHERVLSILHETLQQLQEGDLAPGRALVKELLAWFEQHAASMDMALARHLEACDYRPA